MKYNSTFLYFLFILLSTTSTTLSQNYQAKKAHSAPGIDGIADEICWEEATWAPINNEWLNTPAAAASDFTGRYKATWAGDKIYLLVEVVDDIISETRSNSLQNYWDDDCVEIFLDEDKTAKDHQNNYEAFAYHVSTIYDVVDLGSDGLPHLYNDHVSVKKTNSGNTHTWEMAITVYDNSFVYGEDGNPTITLATGKIIGFTVAYCDADQSGARENFIGSVPDGENSWKQTNLFGAIELIDESTPDPRIEVKAIMDIKGKAVRIAKDPKSEKLYYATTGGDIYEINGTSSKFKYSTGQHGIGYLLGMAFHDKYLYLLGNISSNLYNRGIVKRGELQENGNRIWTTIMETEDYLKSKTAFDHSFNGITVSPDGNFLFLNSGSRTDHGEEHAGKRDVPLTAKIFKIPANASQLKLPNDYQKLKDGGYIFADGTRNSFDLTFAANGHLFGAENAGDRDDPDELNWLREGHHYGFPWEIGGNETPQQFDDFNPDNDKLINPSSIAAQSKFFYNDPSYPSKPQGVVFTAPIQNKGPFANKFRNPVTGEIKTTESGKSLGTFTPHRSPLGLVFDKDSVLLGKYRGGGFILSFTNPESSPLIKEFGEGGDLIHLDFKYDSSLDNYTITSKLIASGFAEPIDAEIVKNQIFVIEFGNTGGKLWQITLPIDSTKIPVDTVPPTLANENGVKEMREVTVSPNPTKGSLEIEVVNNYIGAINVDVHALSGKKMKSIKTNKSSNTLSINLDITSFSAGMYFVELKYGKKRVVRKLLKN